MRIQNMNITVQEKQRLYAALRNVVNDESVRVPNYGICYAVAVSLRKEKHLSYNSEMDIRRYLNVMFTKWPSFSGNERVPIKGLFRDPVRSFVHSQRKWSKWTVYGRRRWKLLFWLLDTLDDEIRKDSIRR